MLKKIATPITGALKKLAEKEINTASLIIMYQPKAPEKLMKKIKK